MKKILICGLSVLLAAALFAETKSTYSSTIEANVKTFNVNLYSEDLKITENDDNKIIIYIYTNKKRLSPNIYKNNDELSIVATKNRYILGDYCNVEVSIPKKYEFKSVDISHTSGSSQIEKLIAKEIYIKSTSGSVSADILNAENTLNISSNSGSLKINKIESDSLDLHTTSGSIKVSDVNVIDAIIESTSGSISSKIFDADSIEIKSISGSVDISDLSTDDFLINTVSGSVNISLYNIPRNSSNIKTTSGSVKIEFQSKNGFNLDFNSTSGSFRDQLTNTHLDKPKNLYKSFFEGGTDIIVKTTSGSLTIY